MRRRSLLILLAILLAAVVLVLVGKVVLAPSVSTSGPPLSTFETDHFAVSLYSRRVDDARKYMEYLDLNVERVEKLVGVEVRQRPKVILYDGDNFPNHGLSWAVGQYDGRFRRI